ncbi:flavin monoamine oxidase family protein [Bacillus alkalicellulosilyticus]|uniref:flavin monoamine oxidase family protein n=1 Tax=Alkalihalobacterium alkalicellulosilyticum TaxID=1912214 RepID=UPI001481E138|nr:FAD-dependent oxidoreductase [Bacillus alkalicellulosilyticus]
MTDVLIIGAGLAGLSAAQELTKAGYCVRILEAKNRVGGRVLSVPYQGGVLELGAQWIAPTHKRVHALLKEANLTLTPTFTKGKTLFFNMNTYEKIDTQPFSLHAKIDMYRFQQKLDKLASTLPMERPWQAEKAMDLDSQSVEKFVLHTLKSETGKRFIQRKLEELMCKNLSEVSLLDLLWNIRAAGSVQNILKAETYWLKEGTQKLAEHLSNGLTKSIEFGEVIQEVCWNDNQVTVKSKQHTWNAKKLILTMLSPLTNEIHFEPPLPTQYVQLTQNIGETAVIKAMVVYDRPFWRDNGLSGSSYGGEGPIHMTVDSSIENQVGVLTIISSGREALSFGKQSEEERKKTVIEILKRLYGEKASTPIYYKEKKWTEEPFIRSGYGSHFPPTVLTQYKEALYQPVGPIHFAGSETATEWRLYMEGALASGERVAQEIIEKQN